MSEEKNYYAFISYKREDEKEAKRLQHQLEYYQLPNQLRKDNPDLPEYVRPVFRDMTDLEVGELSALIHEALEQSHYLIVVCSPRAAQSKWVNDEVEYFISLGKQDKIIPYIIEGVPHADDSSEECYPPALLQLSKEKELLGANINEVGKEAAGIRVVSKMFGIRFDMLYQRYNRIKKRKRVVVFTLGLLGIILVMTLLGYVSYAHQQEEYKEFEKRAFAYYLVQAYTDNFLIPLLNTFDDSKITEEPLKVEPVQEEVKTEVAKDSSVLAATAAIDDFLKKYEAPAETPVDLGPVEELKQEQPVAVEEKVEEVPADPNSKYLNPIEDVVEKPKYVENEPNYVDITKPISYDSVDSIIGELKKVTDKVKKSKYKITTEETNYDDVYTITIKIDKRNFL